MTTEKKKLQWYHRERLRRKRKMLAWASGVWVQWRPEFGAREKWIAEQVNKEIAHEPMNWMPITGYWVTRYTRAIAWLTGAERRRREGILLETGRQNPSE